MHSNLKKAEFCVAGDNLNISGKLKQFAYKLNQ